MSKETSSTAWTRATSRENSPPRIGKYFFKFLTRNSASAISMLLHGEECGAGWFRATRTPGRGDGQYLWVLVRSNFEPAVRGGPQTSVRFISRHRVHWPSVISRRPAYS